VDSNDHLLRQSFYSCVLVRCKIMGQRKRTILFAKTLANLHSELSHLSRRFLSTLSVGPFLLWATSPALHLVLSASSYFSATVTAAGFRDGKSNLLGKEACLMIAFPSSVSAFGQPSGSLSQCNIQKRRRSALHIQKQIYGASTPCHP
jgi:hypothetical protein